MKKRVLDVGQCGPDHAAIRRMLELVFDAEVVQAHAADDTFSALRADSFDLVLINRKLDCDYSDGMAVIRQIKADPKLAPIPCMLVTNYPTYQDSAVAEGAERGFGKDELESSETRDRLARFLA